MAAYPTVTTDESSTRTPRGGHRLDTAEDGTVRGRTLYAATVYEFQLIHPFLSSTNRNLILAHYATDKSSSFSYTWPDGSVAHTCVYAECPQVTWHPGGWTVATQLIGTVT